MASCHGANPARRDVHRLSLGEGRPDCSDTDMSCLAKRCGAANSNLPVTSHRVLLVEDHSGSAALTSERLTEAPCSSFDIRHLTSLAEPLPLLPPHPLALVP